MNRTAPHTTKTTATEYRAEADECIRRNTASALLVTIGAGVVIGLLVRALRPAPTPQQRMARLIEDLEHRLHELAEPVLHRASALASDGLKAAQTGEAHAEHFLGDVARRLRRFFS